jgi:hypothetical protein
MTASTLPYNLPAITSPFDAGKSNSVTPTPSQLANGWIPSVDNVAAEQQNYLHNISTSFLYMAQELGLMLPFNPDPTTHLSIVAVPKGGIVSVLNALGVTEFYVAQNAMSAGFSDPSLDPANWSILNFANIAKYTNPYADGTGTSNAIVGTYPNMIYPVLQDGLQLTIHTTTPNTTTTPTFQPVLNGATLTARTIVKQVYGNTVPLVAGDLTGSCLLEYDLPNTVWILRNPPLQNVLPGTIINWLGATPPPGYLAAPLSPTNISRSAYPALTAELVRQGSPWGAGDGSTTIGMPFFPTGYVPIQGAIASLTHGSVIAHYHNNQVSISGNFPAGPILGSTNQPYAANVGTAPTGGADNLAAGIGVLICVKY